MKIFQRYLASSFIPPFLLSCFFFISFLLTFQLFRIMRIVIGKGVPFQVILELVAHIGVSFLPMAIPLSALFATMYTLNKLSEDSEIVAMRSFGLTKFKLFLPFLCLGVVMSFLIYSLNQHLIPYSKGQFKNTIIKLTSKGVLTEIKSGQFFNEIPGITLFSENVSEDGSELNDIYIQIRGKKEEQVIVATKGILFRKAESKWEYPSLRLNLINGNIIKFNKLQDDIEKIFFEEYDFPILVNDFSPGFVNRDNMLSSSDLSDSIEETKKSINLLETKENIQNHEEHKLNDLRKELSKSLIEYWSRINTPIQCLIFILLGFGLGVKKGRGKTKNTTPLGLLILILYYALFFTGVSLSKKGVIPPVLTVFVPSLITFLIGIKQYKRLDWQS